MYLFWPIFEEKPNENQDLGIEDLNQKSEDEQAEQAYQDAMKKYEKDHDAWEQTHDSYLYNKGFLDALGIPYDASLFKDPPEPQPPSPLPPHADKVQEPKKATKHWELKMAWSQYRRGKWSPKKFSKEGTSTEGIQNLFEDIQPQDFLFNAQETDDGTLLIFPTYAGALSKTYHYGVRLDAFKLVDCNGGIEIFVGSGGWPETLVPSDTHVNAMEFVEDSPGEHPFSLPSGNGSANLDDGIIILNKTPNIFSVAYPHQFPFFTYHYPFFFQDQLHSYFVTPKWDAPPQWSTMPGKMRPGFDGLGVNDEVVSNAKAIDTMSVALSLAKINVSAAGSTKSWRAKIEGKASNSNYSLEQVAISSKASGTNGPQAC